MNGGWMDTPEDEREALDVYQRRCGPLIQSAKQHIQQSLVRIERTKDKWKAVVG
jgi:hypothetical protein